MVEPKNDIAIVVEMRSCHRDGLVRIVREDGKRAGSVKSHTTDRAGVDVVLGQNTVNGRTDAPPYVICGLLLCHRSVFSWQTWLWAGWSEVVRSSLARAATGQCFLRLDRQYRLCRQSHKLEQSQYPLPKLRVSISPLTCRIKYHRSQHNGFWFQGSACP